MNGPTNNGLRVLVTGATGYLGGRLVPRLLERGHQVRVLVRDAERIRGRAWLDRVDVFTGNLLEPHTLPGLCDGIDASYYLVHSMSAGADFAQRDLRAAANYTCIASPAVRLTVYLGGLLPTGGRISPHLRSRAEVGALLRAALPTTEIRAGPIVGSGSASFEMVRYLTERHPLMIVPKCVANEVQPIALRDVLSYLLAVLECDPLGTLEVGGERLSFARMMMAYAEARGLTRRIVVLPLVTPRLIAAWAGLVTPIPHRIAGPLLQGMLGPVVADTRRAAACFPQIQPISYARAVELAIERMEEGRVETRWTGALGVGRTRELVDREGMLCEVRTHLVRASRERLHNVVAGLGGDRGWLAWNRVWWMRGLIDRLLGGPGLRRGRRHPQELLPGEAVDFWRVERIESPGLLRLRAEMKVPGRAWLQWEVLPDGGGTRLVQTALFDPDGLAGFLYWYMLYPIHAAMFRRLACAVAHRAELDATSRGAEPPDNGAAPAPCGVTASDTVVTLRVPA
jgi:uncharacterized protein YbjT (DUF2867 family)